MGVLGQKGRFWNIFGQKWAIFEFSVKNRKRHFFTQKKNQKILMRGFSGNWVLYGRTYKRTYKRMEVNPKVHRFPKSRDQKNQNLQRKKK